MRHGSGWSWFKAALAARSRFDESAADIDHLAPRQRLIATAIAFIFCALGFHCTKNAQAGGSLGVRRLEYGWHQFWCATAFVFS
jgi:hypothetical protein